MTVTLSKEQQNAVDRAKDWFRSGNKQSFVIAGYAGVGKSCVIGFLKDELGLSSSNIAYTAPTGKAVLVMRNKGCYNAMTVHKLIYEPVITRKLKNKEEDVQQLDNVTEDLEPEYEEIVTFVKRASLDEHLELIVVDEASMIGKNIISDLESYGIPILYVGDHGQLPPVKDTFSGIFDNPDIKLETIHRQAEGNPILRASMLARTNNIIPYGENRVNGTGVIKIRIENLTDDMLLSVSQVLCYTNNERNGINGKIRELLGFPGGIPVVGDRIICRKNNYSIGTINGQQSVIRSISKSKKGGLHYIMSVENDSGEELRDLRVQLNGFNKKDLVMFGDFLPFQFAYCITTHLSQGSEFPSVLVFDTYPFWKRDYKNWLYTAITRASSELIIVS